MTAKEFLLKKIESEWKQDLRDVSYDNLEKLSKALDEYSEIKNHGVSHHVSESLLEKYMTHVAHCEGVNFIDDLNTWKSDVKFTDEEVEILNRLNYSR